MMGDMGQAKDYFDRSFKIAENLKNEDLLAAFRVIYSSFCLEIKQYDLALESAIQALPVMQRNGAKGVIMDIYSQMAKGYEFKGNDSSAISFFDKSIVMAETIRGHLQSESQKSNYASKYSKYYEKIILLLNKHQNFPPAFHYAERARARSFLDLLASGQVKIGKPRHREFLARENQYYQQKEETERLIQQAGEDTAQVVLLRGKLEGDWGAVLAGLEEQKRQEPELASLVSVDPLTLPQVQKLLDKGTTLLEYFLTEEKALLWAVTRKQAEVFTVAIGGDSLKALVLAFRQAIETEDQPAAQRLSRQLYDLLIAPAGKLEAKDLVIVPHGILHYLPFAALQNPEGRYLLDDYTLRYLPSASVIPYLIPKRRPRGQRLLALGNPATAREGYPALPQAQAEVQQIGNWYRRALVLAGPQATEAHFKAHAADYDVLHLACHGDLNAAYPLFSCLLLAPDSTEDGELAVHEIFGMDLHASLVVLSGCQTGLGHLTNGDEVVGLTRAFLYAGTPSVLSSLWQVEDASTAYLAERFHHYLQTQDKATALRRAQLDTRDKYSGLHAWAAFVLTGEAK